MGKRCLQSRPRGPAPKISPARKGWVHSQAVERRRRGTTLFVCSSRADDLAFGEVMKLMNRGSPVISFMMEGALFRK
jgi:hypothetical protein